MINNKENANALLKLISKYKLNRMVQSELFSHDYKNFSSFIKEVMNDSSKYGLIMSHLQKGLYNDYSGAELKRMKKVKDYATNRKSITRYMSAMELIRYREAINNLELSLTDLCYRTNLTYNNFYEEAINIGNKTYRDFYIYSNNERIKLKENFFDYSGISLDETIVKYFKKGLRLGMYKKMLTSLNLKKDEVLNVDSKLNYNPFSEIYHNRYNLFRKNFVKTIKALSSSDFTNNDIKKLFTNYEKHFYNTDYLKDNDILIFDYSLGIDKDIYFPQNNLDIFETQLNRISNEIFSINSFDNNFTKEDKFKQINNIICKKAIEDRNNYIAIHLNDPDYFKMPETTSAFTLACLEKIAIDLNPTQFESVIPNTPKLFTEKAKLIAQSNESKEKPFLQKEYQPSFFDNDFDY